MGGGEEIKHDVRKLLVFGDCFRTVWFEAFFSMDCSHTFKTETGAKVISGTIFQVCHAGSAPFTSGPQLR